MSEQRRSASRFNCFASHLLVFICIAICPRVDKVDRRRTSAKRFAPPFTHRSSLSTEIMPEKVSPLRALRHRNYKLFFGGQLTSLVGTWLTITATRWLVFRLAPESEAAELLGFVGFAAQLPTLLLAPFAGVIVDRVNRHRLMVLTQILSAFQSGALAVLALARLITVPQVIWLSVFQGVVNAFDMPARQAFLVEMIEDREDLPNAIALNSSMFNGARLLGPAVAGALITYFGEGICFSVDALSYLAVIAALLAMTIKKSAAPAVERRHPWHELKEGVAYSFGFPPIRTLLFLVTAISFLTMPMAALTPIFADRLAAAAPSDVALAGVKVQHGAFAYGALMAASGLGALCGSIFLARRQSVLGLGRVIVFCCVTLGLGLVGFAQSHTLWLSALALVAAGFGMIVVLASSNTILQTIVADDKRGRVMSLYVLGFMGGAPLGSLAAGQCAKAFGEARTVAVSGILCVLVGVLFGIALETVRTHIRPI